MKFTSSAALGAILLSPMVLEAQTAPTQPAAPATAATAATPTVGATVYDSAGAAVGTIDQVTPQAVVLSVDDAKVSLPPASIGSGPQGLRIALTRAQVVAAAAQAQAGAEQQLMAQLTPGAMVRGSTGTAVGTVKSTDAQYVTLTTTKGDVKLPISGFAMGASGPVIGMTAAQLDAAVTQAGGTVPTSNDAATSVDAAGTTEAGATAAATTATTKTTTTKSTTRTRRQPR
ncbi:hypothetical protein [uncultured Sphingomonas sp.]|uniref:hypothetical protein n=1 Tax=uncultured Sphingomonas sp. TaxID=158754 RepID=UPI0035CC67B2